MLENLFQVVKDAFTDRAIDAIGNEVGLDASSVKTGLTAIIPTVLGGLTGGSSKVTAAPSWWRTVSDLFDKDDDDDLGLGLIGNSKIADIRKGLLGGLFGNNLDQITGNIAGSTGINKEKAGRLLATVAPMVIGFLTRWARRKGLSFTDLIGNLLQNKTAITNALPKGVGANLLGFAADSPERPVYGETRRIVTQPKKPGFNWSWLLLPLAALLLLWLLFGRRCSREPVEVTKPVGEIIDDVTEKARDVTETVRGTLNEAGDWIYDVGSNIRKKLADGFEIEIGTNSVESKLVNFIEDTSIPIDKATWFSLDRTYFESGSSALKAESSAQLDRLAAILKAYPSLKLKIGGYTDSTGDESANMTLSTRRANAAKAELVKRGIAADRLDAEGYGSQHPVCPANDTPECRARNRRIDVRVTAR